MASPAATKRLVREYKAIQSNPPPFIVAHPSESNILEWHYILTGPPNTPYEGGQYWGTLVFPADYPYAPPAIRMHTPSGRFQPSTRLCLSISDFHPRSFNPAWSVSTILLGLQSFMNGNEITTGSIRASDPERKLFAARSRWGNSTNGGTSGQTPGQRIGGIAIGDGGAKFRAEWPEVDAENRKYMRDRRIDPSTGMVTSSESTSSCTPRADALRRTTSQSAVVGAQAARDAGQGWVSRNKLYIFGAVFVVYVIIARLLGESERGAR